MTAAETGTLDNKCSVRAIGTTTSENTLSTTSMTSTCTAKESCSAAHDAPKPVKCCNELRDNASIDIQGGCCFSDPTTSAGDSYINQIGKTSCETAHVLKNTTSCASPCCIEPNAADLIGISQVVHPTSLGGRCCSELPAIDHAPKFPLNTGSGQQYVTTRSCRLLSNSTRDYSLDQKDLEQDAGIHEHCVISVQGMNCTGCETKLSRTLHSIPGVSNVKTSLILARAECEVSSSSYRSVGDVLKYIESKTGFVCSMLNEFDYQLDLLVDDPEKYLYSQDLPNGVSSIEELDARTIRVSYVPEVIGARDLLGQPFFTGAILAPVTPSALIASGRKQLWYMLFKFTLSAVLTAPILVMAWAEIPSREVTYGAISLVLASVIQISIAGPWYVSAFKALVYSRLIEVDILVVLSSSAAYIYSVMAYGFLAAGKPLSTESFFETSTLLITLIVLGRLIATLARQRAVESISIESLQSPKAILVDPKTGIQQGIDSRLLQYGDIFLVPPDSSVVTDGTVMTGISDVNESMITGESALIAKHPASAVIAGSVNHSGTLTVRLTRLTGNNTIKTLELMVDEAKSSKARFQEIADRVAGVFVPIILITTTIIFAVWVGIGKGVRGYSTSQTCINAMTYAIAVLVVSCPCAIGLAVPMVLVIAGGVSAKHGVIFKSAETIEKARKINHIVFDKTGTLTIGKMTVASEIYPTGCTQFISAITQAVCKSNKHPVSIAVATHLSTPDAEEVTLDDFRTIPSCGMEADCEKDRVRAGNPYWLDVECQPDVAQMLSQGMTVFCVTINDTLVAVFGLQDTLQPEATSVVQELQRRSIEVSILSGDNEQAVNSIAAQLGIPFSHVRASCTPADKAAYIKTITYKDSTIMFCGDGTNDAIALVEADIGIHINGGTEIAKSAADAVLIRHNLNGVIVLMDLSRAFYRRVVFNFVWAFAYNVFAILFAAGAFPGVRIEPKWAGLGEIVSVLPVIAIGVSLRWMRFRRD